MTSIIDIKINKPTAGYKKGQVVKVEADGKIPLDRFWRDLLKDSLIDQNCEIVSNGSKAKDKQAKTKTETEIIDGADK